MRCAVSRAQSPDRPAPGVLCSIFKKVFILKQLIVPSPSELAPVLQGHFSSVKVLLEGRFKQLGNHLSNISGTLLASVPFRIVQLPIMTSGDLIEYLLGPARNILLTQSSNMPAMVPFKRTKAYPAVKAPRPAASFRITGVS